MFPFGRVMHQAISRSLAGRTKHDLCQILECLWSRCIVVKRGHSGIFLCLQAVLTQLLPTSCFDPNVDMFGNVVLGRMQLAVDAQIPSEFCGLGAGAAYIGEVKAALHTQDVYENTMRQRLLHMLKMFI